MEQISLAGALLRGAGVSVSDHATAKEQLQLVADLDLTPDTPVVVSSLAEFVEHFGAGPFCHPARSRSQRMIAAVKRLFHSR